MPQQPSMRIVPVAPSKSASLKDTANSLGVHDTLQYGPRSIAAETKSSSNNLEHRLAHVRFCMFQCSEF